MFQSDLNLRGLGSSGHRREEQEKRVQEKGLFKADAVNEEDSERGGGNAVTARFGAGAVEVRGGSARVSVVS